jgi:Protein of unknown function (DUF2971)
MFQMPEQNPPTLEKPNEIEVAQYRGFVNEQVELIFAAAINQISGLPSILWHYTNGESLIEIIKSGDLWTTQVSCLNDQVELRYSHTLLLDAFRKLEKHQDRDKSLNWFQDQVERELTEDNTPQSEWFVSSLSTKEDDLSQWRAYGHGEGGFAIGFDAVKLDVAAKKDKANLVPVCYDLVVQQRVADNVAKATLACFWSGLQSRKSFQEKWAKEFLIEWGNAITYLAPLIKHPKFSEEGEWRLVRQLREDDFKKLKYRSKNTLLARHLPINLSTENLSTNSKILPIAKIIVGPSKNKNVSRVSVADLLKSNDYPIADVKVVGSEVPFQNV